MNNADGSDERSTFDKSKRNALFWSTALLTLLLIPLPKSIEFFSLNGLEVPPQFAVVALTLITAYHAIGFAIATMQMNRTTHEYRDLKSRIESVLDKTATDVAAATDVILLTSPRVLQNIDHARLLVEATNRLVQKLRGGLYNAEQMVLERPIDEYNPHLHFPEADSVESFRRSTKIRDEQFKKTVMDIIEHARKPLYGTDFRSLAEQLNEMLSGITQINQANDALSLSNSAINNLRGSLRRLNRFDKWTFGGYEVFLSSAIILLALGTSFFGLLNGNRQRVLAESFFAQPIDNRNVDASSPRPKTAQQPNVKTNSK